MTTITPAMTQHEADEADAEIGLLVNAIADDLEQEAVDELNAALDDAQPEHPKDGEPGCGATRSVLSARVECALTAGHPGDHTAKVPGRRGKGITWARRSGDPR